MSEYVIYLFSVENKKFGQETILQNVLTIRLGILGPAFESSFDSAGGSGDDAGMLGSVLALDALEPSGGAQASRIVSRSWTALLRT